MKLKTFLHISDLHISDFNFDQEVSRLYAAIPKLDGLLGHDPMSLTMLDRFYADLRIEEEADLIVTGDLTRVGASNEFATATDFLGGELALPRFTGLRNKDWSRLTIPGNHDRYRGKFPFVLGGPTKSFWSYFGGFPLIYDVPLGSSRGHFLRFLLIDTDVNVGSLSVNRILAKGDFVTQLDVLSNMLEKLGPRQPHEIRVICLHHSRSYDGITLGVTARSRAKLDDFIVDESIAVLLSGHIHQPPSAKLVTSVHSVSGTRTHLEVTCGTTTQRNLYHLPYYWRKLLRPSRRSERINNSLFVHRIFEERGEIIWELQLFTQGNSNFGLPRSVETKAIINSHVKVWPQPLKDNISK